MEELVKNADVVICQTKSSGKIPLGFYQDCFKKLGRFLAVADDYDTDDIEGVYMYMNDEFKVVDLKKFKSLYKAIKNVA